MKASDVAVETCGTPRPSVGWTAGQRKPDIEANCSQSFRLRNADALGITRATLRIRLAKMLFAELLQLFALETWQSYWQAFSSLRSLSKCERRLPSTRAFSPFSP